MTARNISTESTLRALDTALTNAIKLNVALLVSAGDVLGDLVTKGVLTQDEYMATALEVRNRTVRLMNGESLESGMKFEDGNPFMSFGFQAIEAILDEVKPENLKEQK